MILKNELHLHQQYSPRYPSEQRPRAGLLFYIDVVNQYNYQLKIQISRCAQNDSLCIIPH